LAQVDLEMRREGDILGATQSGGASSLKWIRVVKDLEVIELAGQLARELILEDPQLKSVPELKQRFDEQSGEEQISHLYKS
ncbi:MAG TPA: ATP-dependent DNA helicase RecG, partial [Microbacteriaceae bacterium]|nr:ATP-dependent DNA helicase RecG [Microbacteriaceae bacterium]